MAVDGVFKMTDVKRWTGKKKAEAVIEIIKGNCTLVDFCRANDLKQSEVQSWMDDFVSSGTKGLKVNAKDQATEHRKEVEQLQQVIGEQALHIRVLKKSIELQEEEENES